MSKAPSSPEIERKFLVDPNALPFDLHTLNGAKIEQGYLAVNKNSSTEVRVRRRDGAATLTVKKGKGRVRDEGEINLTGGKLIAQTSLRFSSRGLPSTAYGGFYGMPIK